MTTPRARLLAAVPVLAIACSAWAPLAAADPDNRHDLWLSVQSMPRDYDVEIEDYGIDDLTYDSAGRLSFGYRGRFGADVAFTAGAGLAFTSEERDDDHLAGFGVVLEPGISFRLAPRFELNIAVPIGIGGTRFDFDTDDEDDDGNDDDDDEDDTGSYAEIGVVVRPTFTFQNGILLYADLGFIGRRQEFTFDTVIGDVDTTIESRGFIAGAGIGYRF